jgi:predicted flap endonuclease-1-like 5' DNA nuclease
MFSLTGMLCRLCRCVSPGSSAAESTAESADEARAPDDLTAIRGLGKASQDRLQAAGIKTYAQLAQAAPEDLRDSLGIGGQGAKVEDWIAQAKALANGSQ